MLRAIYNEARNLFSAESVRAIVLGVVASFIYERAFSVDQGIKVEISSKEVIVESGKNKIIVSRDVYDATRLAEQNPQFGGAIDRTFQAVSSDEHVNGIGIVPKMDSPPPEFLISRNILHEIDIDVDLTHEPETRIIQEHCELQIIKAILERSSRKWEFMWRGVRISAPVLDDKFYSDFFAHQITIAPGDELEVQLAIKQDRDANMGVYTNVEYTVLEVFKHIPRLKQSRFPAH